MKKFEYKQIDYTIYPTANDLNREGINGWETLFIYEFKREKYDIELDIYYDQKMYKVTFKREINEH